MTAPVTLDRLITDAEERERLAIKRKGRDSAKNIEAQGPMH